MRISRHVLCVCVSMALACGVSPAEAGAGVGSDLDNLIVTYNALPDTSTPLTIPASDAPEGSLPASLPAPLPAWVRNLSLTRQETAALVALAGAYGQHDTDTSATSTSATSATRKRNPLEYAAGLALALKTQDEINRNNRAGSGNLCCATKDPPAPPRQKTILRPPSERFIRLIGALETCPGAFASLALKLHSGHGGSELDAHAQRARTDNLAFATLPDPTCLKP